MKAEYLDKQIEASLDEILDALLAALSRTVGRGAFTGVAIELSFESFARVYRAGFKEQLGFTDSTDEDKIALLSDRFHAALAENLQFASVALQDGGENE